MASYGHDITIREVMNGFVVRVGCEHIVIEGNSLKDAVDSLCSRLQDYLYNRSTTQKLWYETYRPFKVAVAERLPTAENSLVEVDITETPTDSMGLP